MTNQKLTYKKLQKPGIKDMHNIELLQACKENSDILSQFLQNNKHFVFGIIRKYKGSIESIKAKFRIEEDELLHHAYLGVLSALREFDCTKGVKFTTYVVRPILWELNQLFYNHSHQVRLSRGAVHLMKRIKEIEEQLGYTPSVKELSTQLDVPIERLLDIIRFSGELDSIDAGNSIEITEHTAQNEQNIINKIYVQQMLEKAPLNDFEREVIRLIKDESLNNSKISERLGVYPMTIHRTLEKIRQKIEQTDSHDNKQSKYEQEISLLVEEIKELGYIPNIEEMKDLLEVCGYDIKQYTPRNLYYVRQKAKQRAKI